MNLLYTLCGPDGEITLDTLRLKQHVEKLSGPGPFTLRGTCRSCHGTGRVPSGFECPQCVGGRFTETFATAEDLRSSVNSAT